MLICEVKLGYVRPCIPMYLVIRLVITCPKRPSTKLHTNHWAMSPLSKKNRYS